MAKTKRLESFVWSDREVEVLLRLTLEYKLAKRKQNVDWESCQAKYTDLLEVFQERYPTKATDDFPHDPAAITRTQFTGKLKSIRGKYRRAVETGRRGGHGRVVILFYELCQEIWDASPVATRSIESAVETDDLLGSSGSSTPTPLEEPPGSPSPAPGEESRGCPPPPPPPPDSVVKQRRHLFQVGD